MALINITPFLKKISQLWLNAALASDSPTIKWNTTLTSIEQLGAGNSIIRVEPLVTNAWAAGVYAQETLWTLADVTNYTGITLGWSNDIYPNSTTNLASILWSGSYTSPFGNSSSSFPRSNGTIVRFYYVIPLQQLFWFVDGVSYASHIVDLTTLYGNSIYASASAPGAGSGLPNALINNITHSTELITNFTQGTSTTTFDPAFTGGLVVLSNGNLTMQCSNGITQSSVGTVGYSSGVHYFEFEKTGDVGASGTIRSYIGVVREDERTAVTSTAPGFTANSWGLREDSFLWNNSAITSPNSLLTFAQNDKIGLILDMDNLKLTWHFGQLIVAERTITAGTYYIAIGGNRSTIDLNAGASAFSYVPFTGANW